MGFETQNPAQNPARGAQFAPMNPFTGLTAAQLTTLQTDALACLSAILRNQSYSLQGRTLTRANLADVQRMLGDINSALADANGTGTSETYVNLVG